MLYCWPALEWQEFSKTSCLPGGNGVRHVVSCTNTGTRKLSLASLTGNRKQSERSTLDAVAGSSYHQPSFVWKLVVYQMDMWNKLNGFRKCSIWLQVISRLQDPLHVEANFGNTVSHCYRWDTDASKAGTMIISCYSFHSLILMSWKKRP